MTLKRNYGFEGSQDKYITQDEAAEGYVFNLWIGIGIGIVLTCITFLGFLYFAGWI